MSSKSLQAFKEIWFKTCSKKTNKHAFVLTALCVKTKISFNLLLTSLRSFDFGPEELSLIF